MFVEVNGIQLYYETSGEGKPLILLHGNGEDHTIFDKLIEPLSKRYRIYAIDSRNHGRSGRAGSHSYEQMADDVIRFCEALSIHKPRLYGFSDGGIIGLLVAANKPGLLCDLTVSGANLSPKGLKKWYRLLCKVGYFFTRRERVKMMLTQPHITADMLARITVPVHVMAGERDVIRLSHTKRIAQSIRNATATILKGEGHASYVVHSSKLLTYL